MEQEKARIEEEGISFSTGTMSDSTGVRRTTPSVTRHILYFFVLNIVETE